MLTTIVSRVLVNGGTGGASQTIENAAVTSTTSIYAGVCVQSGTNSSTTNPILPLAVNDGSLTASGSTSQGGIQFVDNSDINATASTSLTVSDNAIVDAKTGGIKAIQNLSSIDTAIRATGSSGGIIWNGKNGTVYGDVTLQEVLEIVEGETLTIGKDASLTVPEGTTSTNNGTINVESGGKLEGTISGNTPPTISSQPTDRTVTEGNTATFTVEAIGSDLFYQWQKNTDNGSGWTDISGVTDTNYTTETTTTSMNGYQYRCVVTGSAGSVTSDTATLTVSATIYTISTDVTLVGAGTVTVNGISTSARVEVGTSVTLIVTPASGYHFVRWEESGAEVNTSATYTFAASGNRTLTAVLRKISAVVSVATAPPMP